MVLSALSGPFAGTGLKCPRHAMHRVPESEFGTAGLVRRRLRRDETDGCTTQIIAVVANIRGIDLEPCAIEIAKWNAELRWKMVHAATTVTIELMAGGGRLVLGEDHQSGIERSCASVNVRKTDAGKWENIIRGCMWRFVLKRGVLGFGLLASFLAFSWNRISLQGLDVSKYFEDGWQRVLVECLVQWMLTGAVWSILMWIFVVKQKVKPDSKDGPQAE
ncbi:MAG: hypothetical protein BAA02_10040 [Paenibacillaceae bacterium ZCTH02-B3]|nr:MAG: hypothetical protein BAA02_10040 [Paenibacillaceae bacterium ZCTH02-B3]